MLAMNLIELLGLAVIGLHLVVAEGPGRRDAVVVPHLAEILLAQAIERRAEHFRRAADEIVNLRLEPLAVGQEPGVRRNVAIGAEDVLDAPVARLARQPIAALKDQDFLARRRQAMGERAAAGAAANDDDVVDRPSRYSPGLLCMMPPSAKIVVAVR